MKRTHCKKYAEHNIYTFKFDHLYLYTLCQNMNNIQTQLIITDAKQNYVYIMPACQYQYINDDDNE